MSVERTDARSRKQLLIDGFRSKPVRFVILVAVGWFASANLIMNIYFFDFLVERTALWMWVADSTMWLAVMYGVYRYSPVGAKSVESGEQS